MKSSPLGPAMHPSLSVNICPIQKIYFNSSASQPTIIAIVAGDYDSEAINV
jgi:hypothetical protein